VKRDLNLNSSSALSPSSPKPRIPESSIPRVEKKPESGFVDEKGMVFVEGGAFEMGDTFGDGRDNERPVHQVTLSDFWIGRYAVTFEEYDAFCAATGKEKPEDEGWGRVNRPVINVSWNDAVAYCNWRSEREGLEKVYQINDEKVEANWQAKGYRLPTEAEWEFAARGGRKSKGFEYSGGNELDPVGWYEPNSEGRTHPVGQKLPNELGLYDMSGNVWERCWDWYGDYSPNPQTNPKGPDTGDYRVIRGGSCYSSDYVSRVAYRDDYYPYNRYYYDGFRLTRYG
jgi:formylglycine-generating enzyme required for sulfatase activity